MNNQDFKLIQQLQSVCKEFWNDIYFKIYDVRKGRCVYGLSACRKNRPLDFDKFYTKDKEKGIPNEIMNESLEKRKTSFIGFYRAEGHKKIIKKKFESLKNIRLHYQVYIFLRQSLGLKTCIGIRDDKFNVFYLNTIKKLSDEKVHKIINLGKQNDYVYEKKTETHDFNCGFPLIVHNTDSFVLGVNTENITEDIEKFQR